MEKICAVLRTFLFGSFFQSLAETLNDLIPPGIFFCFHPGHRLFDVSCFRFFFERLNSFACKEKVERVVEGKQQVVSRKSEYKNKKPSLNYKKVLLLEPSNIEKYQDPESLEVETVRKAPIKVFTSDFSD